MEKLDLDLQLSLFDELVIRNAKTIDIHFGKTYGATSYIIN